METKKSSDCDRSNFTLAQSIPFEIKIAGRPSENWSDWITDMEIEIETDPTGLVTTVLRGFLDQAALIGLLRQLYYLGFPIISVNCHQAQEIAENRNALSNDYGKEKEK